MDFKDVAGLPPSSGRTPHASSSHHTQCQVTEGGKVTTGSHSTFQWNVRQAGFCGKGAEHELGCAWLALNGRAELKCIKNSSLLLKNKQTLLLYQLDAILRPNPMAFKQSLLKSLQVVILPFKALTRHSTVSIRMPLNPLVRTLMRRASIHRTWYGWRGGPTPTAWEFIRFICSLLKGRWGVGREVITRSNSALALTNIRFSLDIFLSANLPNPVLTPYTTVRIKTKNIYYSSRYHWLYSYIAITTYADQSSFCFHLHFYPQCRPILLLTS